MSYQICYFLAEQKINLYKAIYFTSILELIVLLILWTENGARLRFSLANILVPEKHYIIVKQKLLNTNQIFGNEILK